MYNAYSCLEFLWEVDNECWHLPNTWEYACCRPGNNKYICTYAWLICHNAKSDEFPCRPDLPWMKYIWSSQGSPNKTSRTHHRVSPKWRLYIICGGHEALLLKGCAQVSVEAWPELMLEDSSAPKLATTCKWKITIFLCKIRFRTNTFIILGQMHTKKITKSWSKGGRGDNSYGQPDHKNTIFHDFLKGWYRGNIWACGYKYTPATLCLCNIL